MSPRLLDKLVSVWAMLGGIILLVITVVTSLNVGANLAGRLSDVLGGGHIEGLPGYEDFVRLVISCAALMFFPYCQMKRGHVAVTLFTDKMPRAVRDAIARLWPAAIAALALFLAYWMAIGMLETRDDMAATAILGWTIWPFYIPGLLSLVLWALVAVHQTVFEPEEV